MEISWKIHNGTTKLGKHDSENEILYTVSLNEYSLKEINKKNDIKKNNYTVSTGAKLSSFHEKCNAKTNSQDFHIF